MKTKWQLSMAIALILLFVSSVIGCGQAYSEANLDAARQAAHEAGHAQGYSAGHDKGYETGKADGYEAGKDEGYDVGYAEGYDAGIIELESIIQEAEKFGYDKGYEAGIAAAQQEAQEAEQAAEAERAAAMARLDDLAYIKAYLWSYTDDADPEAEGVYLTISFYDSKSARIYVSDVPITVSFKIYNVSGETSHPTKGYDPLIYQDTVSINSTMERIKIPFDKLYGPYYKSPITKTITFVEKWLEVTVITPNQEDFSVTDKAVWLQ